MAFQFDGGTTDKVTVTNPQTFGSGSEISWVQWVKYNGAPSNSQGTGKGTTSDVWVYSLSSGRYFFNVGRATTMAEAGILGGTLSTGIWYFIAGTYSEADGVRLYIGTLTSPPAEPTYNSRVVGAGATTANSGDLYINNRGASNTLAMPADIAEFQWYSRCLTPGEIMLLWQRMIPLPNCEFYGQFGYNGTGNPADLSGKGRSLVPTNLVVAPHVPIRPALLRPVRYQKVAVAGGGTVNLSIASLSIGSPSIGVPVANYIRNLAIANLNIGSPSYGPVSWTQRHALTANGLTTASPDIGSPTFGQRHPLNIPNFATASPDVGTPSLGVTGIANFTIPGVEIGSPTFGNVGIGQRHVFNVPSFSNGSPSIGTPAFSQRHAFTSSGLIVGPPDLGTPVISVAGIPIKRGNVLAADPEYRTLWVDELRYLSADVEMRVLSHDQILPA